MKKALAVLTVIILTATLSFYLIKNNQANPLHIRNLTVQNFIGSDSGETKPVNPDLININIAGIEQLVTLPGIGPVLAQRIIDYRTEHGLYHSPAELINVKGIGMNTLENILDLITTGGST